MIESNMMVFLNFRGFSLRTRNPHYFRKKLFSSMMSLHTMLIKDFGNTSAKMRTILIHASDRKYKSFDSL